MDNLARVLLWCSVEVGHIHGIALGSARLVREASLMEFTALNWINVLFAVVCGNTCIDCYKDGRDLAGHLNGFAFAINAAVVAARLF